MTKTTGLELLMLICWALIASYTVSMVSIQLHERKLIDICKKTTQKSHTRKSINFVPIMSTPYLSEIKNEFIEKIGENRL